MRVPAGSLWWKGKSTGFLSPPGPSPVKSGWHWWSARVHPPSGWYLPPPEPHPIPGRPWRSRYPPAQAPERHWSRPPQMPAFPIPAERSWSLPAGQPYPGASDSHRHIQYRVTLPHHLPHARCLPSASSLPCAADAATGSYRWRLLWPGPRSAHSPHISCPRRHEPLYRCPSPSASESPALPWTWRCRYRPASRRSQPQSPDRSVPVCSQFWTYQFLFRRHPGETAR